MIRRPPRSTLSSSSAASDVYKRQTRKGRLGAWECTGDDGRRGPLGGRDGAVWRRPGLPGGGLWGPPGAVGVGPGPRCPWRGRPGSAAAAPIGVCGLPAHPGAAAGERAAAPGGRGDGDRGDWHDAVTALIDAAAYWALFPEEVVSSDP